MAIKGLVGKEGNTLGTEQKPWEALYVNKINTIKFKHGKKNAIFTNTTLQPYEIVIDEDTNELYVIGADGKPHVIQSSGTSSPGGTTTPTDPSASFIKHRTEAAIMSSTDLEPYEVILAEDTGDLYYINEDLTPTKIALTPKEPTSTGIGNIKHGKLPELKKEEHDPWTMLIAEDTEEVYYVDNEGKFKLVGKTGRIFYQPQILSMTETQNSRIFTMKVTGLKAFDEKLTLTPTSSEYRIFDGRNELVFDSDIIPYAETFTIEFEKHNKQYYVQMRHYDYRYGWTEWSNTQSMFIIFNSEQILDRMDLGVGFAGMEIESLGLTAMVGADDPDDDNFGNYVDKYGNVCVCIPAYYYRIGNEESPRYGKYGVNTIDIVPLSTYKTEAEANEAGWTLHRGFIDDGQVKPYFFMWKYIASRNGDLPASVKNGNTLSLCSSSTYTSYPSSVISGCNGKNIDAFILAERLGYGWNVPVCFMYSAVRMSTLYIAESSDINSNVAWYDSTDTINFPKGQNSTNLYDIKDNSVKFTKDGSSSSIAKTGSGVPFAKTTHNGKNSGIADINGIKKEASFGFTGGGVTSESDYKDPVGWYLLKHSAKFADMNYMWNDYKGIWGDDNHLSELYDKVTAPITVNSTSNYIGIPGKTVFFMDMSDSLRDFCGCLPAPGSFTTSTSNTMINLFGKAKFINYFHKNYVQFYGSAYGDSTYGNFYQVGGISGDSYISNYNSDHGFRCAAYPI